MVIRCEYGGQANHKGKHIPGEDDLGKPIQYVWEIDVAKHGEEGDQVRAQDRVPSLNRETVVELRSAENEVCRDEIVGGSHG